MKTLFFLILSTFIIYFMSCASAETTMTDFKNPDYKGEKVGKVIVFLLLDDLELRKTAEDIIEETVNETGYKFVSSLNYLSPIKKYSNEELENIFEKNNIDGVCVISVMSVTSEQTYVPETKFYDTKGKGTLFGDYFNYKSTTTVSSFGGYYANKPIVKVETALFERKTQEMLWYAQSTTSGNRKAGVSTIVQSYAEKLISQLHKEKLLK